MFAPSLCWRNSGALFMRSPDALADCGRCAGYFIRTPSGVASRRRFALGQAVFAANFSIDGRMRLRTGFGVIFGRAFCRNLIRSRGHGGDLGGLRGRARAASEPDDPGNRDATRATNLHRAELAACHQRVESWLADGQHLAGVSDAYENALVPWIDSFSIEHFGVGIRDETAASDSCLGGCRSGGVIFRDRRIGIACGRRCGRRPRCPVAAKPPRATTASDSRTRRRPGVEQPSLRKNGFLRGCGPLETDQRRRLRRYSAARSAVGAASIVPSAPDPQPPCRTHPRARIASIRSTFSVTTCRSRRARPAARPILAERPSRFGMALRSGVVLNGVARLPHDREQWHTAR